MLSVKDSRLPGGLPPSAKKLPESSTISHFAHSAATQEIPGNPDLITHGEMTLVDGGLSFDGHESYAVSQIASDDCIINPEMCNDGMSFGTKLKFDKISDDRQRRYIVDTGAHNKHVRGFSLFSERDNLVALVRSAEREWKVSWRLTLQSAITMKIGERRPQLLLFFKLQHWLIHFVFAALRFADFSMYFTVTFG